MLAPVHARRMAPNESVDGSPMRDAAYWILERNELDAIMYIGKIAEADSKPMPAMRDHFAAGLRNGAPGRLTTGGRSGGGFARGRGGQGRTSERRLPRTRSPSDRGRRLPGRSGSPW